MSDRAASGQNKVIWLMMRGKDVVQGLRECSMWQRQSWNGMEGIYAELAGSGQYGHSMQQIGK